MELVECAAFKRWLIRLRDTKSKMRITARLLQFKRSDAVTGDVKALGGGLAEVRFHFGPGYRVYVSQQGSKLLLLLAGGDKSSQQKDIALARELLDEWKVEHGE